ncbi:hypothetical protein BDR04DRAFT_1150095 [Suillus decipiens]|nr:hypothetical protein BDR04DRAFT_1150095 [Suillus decipiens]
MFYMPLCRMPAAPFFNSNPADLLTFLITVDRLADMAGITEVVHIKAAAWYAHPDKAELWECLEEYNSNDYEEFTNTVLYAYPGHGNETFKRTAACTADAPLTDSCEEDAIEYSDAGAHCSLISPIINTEEQTTLTDIMITLLTFETLPMACQNEVPVPAASPPNVALPPVQHSEPSLLPEDRCDADNTIHNSNNGTLSPHESAITITYSVIAEEEADTTKIERECLPLRYSINVKAALSIDTITEAITECPPLTKVLPSQIETMQQNSQQPRTPKLALTEEIPDADDGHPWSYGIIRRIAAYRAASGVLATH